MSSSRDSARPTVISRKPVAGHEKDLSVYKDPQVDKGHRKPSKTLEERIGDVKLEETTALSPTMPSIGSGLANDTPVPLVDANEPTPRTSTSSTTAKLATAYREARHLAGGLMHHPSESTKHFTLLRHSHGLVYYQGISTSVAVSIFSDTTLPADRTLWLQSKGWTGKTGWRAKRLVGRDGDWIDVTPSTRVTADQLNPSDERAWQRDINHFLRKGPSGHSRNHKIRETAIIRIPVEAHDGYFRVVLCGQKKKVLCPSPVFRIASTSSSPASIRGASLGNLPLEIGASLLSSTAASYIGNAIAPITGAVQNQVAAYEPGFWEQEAATTAYSVSGAEDQVGNVGQTYDATRDASYDLVTEINPPDSSLPKSPYPIRFSSKIVRGTGRSTAALGMPTANLASLREDLAYRLQGHYFGYARLTSPPPSQAPLPEAHHAWSQAIISILPKSEVRAQVAAPASKTTAVYMIDDFGGASFEGAQMEVSVLGFLRPSSAAEAQGLEGEKGSNDAALAAAFEDVTVAQARLANLRCDPTGRPLEGERGGAVAEKSSAGPVGFSDLSSSLTDKYVAARQGAQRQVDRIPFQRAGVRVGVEGLRDRNVGKGGLFVVR